MNIESKIPVPEVPSKNLLRRLNIYLPWDGLKEGQSFFIPGADERDRQSIWMAASRRKIKIRSEFRTEEAGAGLRVWRVG